MPIACIDAKHVADRHGVVWSLADAYVVAGPDIAFDDDPQVRPRPARLSETARKQLVLHPGAESPEGDARLRHFENGVADFPTLADKCAIHVDVFGREVLAKLAMPERATQLVLPPAQVFGGIGIDRLVGPAVRVAGLWCMVRPRTEPVSMFQTITP